MSMLSLHRHLSFMVIGIIIAVLLAACGGPEIALNGTVTDAYTGKPVPAASVRLGNQQITTDPQGQFRISQWSVQDTLQVSANGYAPESIALTTQPNLAKPTPPAVTLDT